VKRAVLLTKKEIVQVDVLEMEESSAVKDLSLHNVKSEKTRIEEALRMTGNHKGKAAALLGIDRKTLYNKMKTYGM
jgi:two-component system response regulator HydG